MKIFNSEIIVIIIFILTSLVTFTYTIYARPTRIETKQLITDSETNITRHLDRIYTKLNELDKDNTTLLLKMIDLSVNLTNDATFVASKPVTAIP